MSISGSATLDNTRLSLADGKAFVDFSLAGLFAPYLNYRITVFDSSGCFIIGYVKSIGTGETLGDTLNVSNCLNMASPFDYNTFDGESATGFHAVNTSGAIKIATTADELALVAGGLFKPVFTLTLTSGQAPSTSFRDSFGSANLGRNAVLSTAGANSYYTTLTASVTGLLRFDTMLNSEYTVADLAIKQVLTPANTGVTITNTPNGSTYNWESIDSGFNYNDASGYRYMITVSSSGLRRRILRLRGR